MQTVIAKPVASVSLLVSLCVPSAGAANIALYVAPNGNDTWSGTRLAPNAQKTDGPFRSLERARDEIRKRKAAGPLPAGEVVVELQPGVYERSRTFKLTAEDSGTPDCRIVWRGAPSGDVRLVGGKMVGGWTPVTAAAVLARMDETARDKVRQADLRAQGVTHLGEMKAGKRWGASSPGLEVFFNDEPMTLARWPNEGFVTIPQVFGDKPQNIRGTKGFMDGIFGYKGDRPSRWLDEKDVMLHGYWFWDWADQRLKVGTIDTEQKRITVDPEPRHHFGFRKNMYYYAYNLLPELDRPGEWYLDREKGILYFWPSSPLDKGQVMISVLPTLLSLQDVSHVTFNGMFFECTRGTALSLKNVTGVRIERSIVRNTGDWGVVLAGKDSGIVGCDLYNLASGGVSVVGGNRKTLTPSGLYVDNCHFYRFGRWNPICKPGVTTHGHSVGHRITHNLFNDAPHMAIMWGGNDHLFEYNEFHSVVRCANDAGIMYAGYNPAMRGHMIRYNYFHHVYGHHFKGCNGVYLDDMFCSATIYGNVFYQVPRAAFIGGGHDNIVENNIFVDCKPALHVDARMMGWASKSVDTMRKRLEAMPYKEDPWRSRYPKLLTYLEGNYAQPRGNIVARNICWGGRWDEIGAKARPGVKLVDNLVGVDPKFVDAANEDFRLRLDSPAFALGFKPIPFEKIGLYESPLRVTWPVKTEVRYPDPKPKAKRKPKPVFSVRRLRGVIVIDGALGAAEWNGLSPAHAMAVEQDLQGDKTGPPSTAWLLHDDAALYVAVANRVDPDKPLRMGDTWGRDDAVELAFKNSGGGPAAPILILRGYPSGNFVSSDEAGASAQAVSKATEGVSYAAKIIGKDRWTVEWRIPFAALGVDPKTTPKIPFSLTVRKTADRTWVLWAGTNHATWNVDNAGFLELKQP